MIRRFILWLAREEIAKARAEEKVLAAIVKQNGAVELQTAYLRGYAEGSDDTCNSIEAAILARTGGKADLATLADVQESKKGRTH